MARNTKFGKIVWAKLRGSSPWPAKGIEPIPDIKKPVRKTNWFFVRFYGSNDHAWVEYDTQIWPYKEYRLRYGEKDKATALFREGVRQADAEYELLSSEDMPHSGDDDTEFISVKKEKTKKINKSKTEKKRKHSTEAKQATDTGGTKQPKNSPAKANGASGDKLSSRSPKYTYSSPAKQHQAAKQTALSEESPPLKRETQSIYDFVDETKPTQTYSAKKRVKTSSASQRIGFIGLGTVGMCLAKNLLKHGHRLCVWNRTASKCSELDDVDVQVASTPAEVITECDITLACLSDSFAVKEVLFCKYGVLEAMQAGKGFIDFSTMDGETLNDADEQIHRQGGMYLEAPLSGTRSQAADGSLLIMAAGNQKLYESATSCLQALSSKCYYLGNTAGMATQMKLALHMISGSVTAAVSEGMALAERIGVNQSTLANALSHSACGSELINKTCQAILSKKFTASNISLHNIQKDMRLAIDSGDTHGQPLHVAASANELYKRGKSMGLSSQDMSAVYQAISK